MGTTSSRYRLGNLERLEGRDAPAVLTVSSITDFGLTSLRGVLAQANSTPEPDTIVFADNLAGAQILLTTAGDRSEGPTALVVTAPLTIIGTGQTLARNGVTDPLRLFLATAPLNLQNLTLTGGRVNGGSGTDGSTGRGGAILSTAALQMANVTLTGNEADAPGSAFGGAVAVDTGGSLAASDCTFTNNQAVGGSAVGPDHLAQGGAVFAGAGQSVNLFRCLLTGNQATGGDGGTGTGGAVAIAGGSFSGRYDTFAGNHAVGGTGGAAGAGGGLAFIGGTATLIDSTIANNSADGTAGGPGEGGGLFTDNAAVTLAASTVANNAANSSDASGRLGAQVHQLGDTTATLTLVNNILWGGNAGAADLFNGRGNSGSVTVVATAPNLVGSVQSQVGATLNGGGLILGANPLLGPLQDNGGRNPTMALLAGSPALDAGVPGTGITVDQRGAARDDRPDLGAYEVHHPLSPVGVPADFSTLYAPHPSDTTLEAFIKGLYQATLLRPGSSDEVDFYVNQVVGHLVTTQQMASNFYNSPENRGNQVRYYYRYFLGREPSQSEVDYYVKRLQAGEDEGVIMQNFILSPEYTGRNNNTQFVNTMYYSVLGRTATPSEVNFYVSRLNANTLSREQVVQNFLRSPESIQRVVRSDYTVYLKRPVDEGALLMATAELQNGVTFGQVASDLLGSQEFWDNAGNNH